MDTKEILKSLSVDDKIRLLSGVGDWHTYDCGGKIPAIMMTDGPHGLRKVENERAGDIENSKPATCFPTASALASSFNVELLENIGKAIAREAKKEKISMVLGCGINIKRSPLCGRNFEYFSEDPFLAGKLATSYIRGVESLGIGTSLKHFAVNSQEKRRMTSNSEVDERTLREIYLSAFEETIKNSKPASVMASYNRVNGDYATRNSHLLKDILRDEWGYEGAVISDWGAVNSVKDCYKNGLSLEMPDSRGFHTSELKKAYEAKEITDEELDNYAGNVINTLVKLHENVEENFMVDMKAQHEVARNAENECAILLKNEGAFPISKEKKVIIIGELAEHVRYQGGGSSHIQPTFLKSAIDTFSEEGFDVVYIKGYSNDTDVIDEALTKEALETLRKEYKKGTCTVLFFLGLTDSYEGEGYDREDINLPYNQTELLDRVAAIVDYNDLAAISFGGSPIDFSFDQNVSSLLHMYLGGQAVAESVCDIVSGKVNPSGRLSETMPLARTDVPCWRYYANDNNDVEYREALFVGYRYYESFEVPVKYPFGYGLSYTTFEYSDIKVSDVYEGGTLKVCFKVKNTGSVAGKEVAQVYVLPEKENFIRSSIELKGFTKISLNPGEEKEVCVELNERSFSVFDVDKMKFSVVGGVYTVAVGASVKDLKLKQNVVVQGDKYFRNEKELFPDYFKPQPHGMEIGEAQFEALYGKRLSNEKNRKRGEFEITDSFIDVASKSLFGNIFRFGIGIALKFMFPGKKKTDPAYKMIYMGLNEGNLEGLIASSGGLMSKKLVDMLVYNANRHYLKAFLRMFSA